VAVFYFSSALVPEIGKARDETSLRKENYDQQALRQKNVFNLTVKGFPQRKLIR